MSEEYKIRCHWDRSEGYRRGGHWAGVRDTVWMVTGTAVRGYRSGCDRDRAKGIQDSWSLEQE
jgi:hypothetical protein